MSDPLREALSAQLKALPNSLPEMAVSWPLLFPRVRINSFQPFGLVATTPAEFSTEWAFRYEKQDSNLEVLAMFTGLLTWQPIESILRLESFHHPSEMLNLLDEEWPEWMPIARTLEYRFLDSPTVHYAMVNIIIALSTEQRAAIDANAPELSGLSPSEVADRFMSMGPGPSVRELTLPVRQGVPLGSGQTTGTETSFAVRARQRSTSAYFVNLAYQTATLHSHGYMQAPQITMAGGADPAATSAALLSSTGPIIGSGTVRTVAASGADHTSVQSAVRIATPGDLILITDTSTYGTTSSIVIDKPLVISSLSTSNARTDATGFPTLHGVKPPDPRSTATWATSAKRALEVVGQRNGQPTFVDGVVQLSNIRISQSAASHGGGIWVDECPQVWIENIRFESNEAFGGGWLYEGFGGAIGTRHAGIKVQRCTFLGNSANCRGGGLGVFGYGWPIVTDCHFETNRSGETGVWNPNSLKPFRQRPDGGGIGLQMATPNAEALYAEVAVFIDQHPPPESAAGYPFYLLNAQQTLSAEAFALVQALGIGSIEGYWDQEMLTRSRRNSVIINRCTFKSNTSQDDGGGLYATGLVKMSLRECRFEDNKADSNGGGMRVSTACTAILDSCTFLGNQSNAQKHGFQCVKKDGSMQWAWYSVGGGALAARSSNISLVNVTMRDNIANRYAGGAIFFTSTDEGAFQGFNGKNDWNTVRELLMRCGTKPCPEFSQISLVIEGGEISQNTCGWTPAGTSPPPPPASSVCGTPPATWAAEDTKHAKGGGIYALRYLDGSTEYPPIAVSIKAGATLTSNLADFSTDATDLFIADLKGPPGKKNPAADSSALTRNATGALVSDYQFNGAP